MQFACACSSPHGRPNVKTCSGALPLGAHLLTHIHESLCVNVHMLISLANLVHILISLANLGVALHDLTVTRPLTFSAAAYSGGAAAYPWRLP